MYSCESETCENPTLLQDVLGLFTLVAPSGKVKITFTSDGSLTRDGFTAVWTFVPACNSSLGEYSWGSACITCSSQAPPNSVLFNYSAPDTCHFVCDVGHFGPNGEPPCSECPENSNSVSVGSSTCTCNIGYVGPDGGPCSACEAGKFKCEGLSLIHI